MIRYFIFLLFLLIFGSAFGQDSLQIITSEQRTIDVKENEPFIIKFRECRGCPVHWYLDKDESDTLNVRLIEVTYKNTNGRQFNQGGEVFELWKFTGLAIGRFDLEFVQKGPGKDHNEIERLEFELWVR